MSEETKHWREMSIAEKDEAWDIARSGNRSMGEIAAILRVQMNELMAYLYEKLERT